MPKKNMTPEEKAAWAAKMQAAKIAKKQQETPSVDHWQPPVESLNRVPETPKDPETPRDPGNTPNAEVDELKRQIEEMKANQDLMLRLFASQAPQTGPQVANGRLIGTHERYIVDPAHYPDPRERLKNEAKLQRFAFKDNYELDFEVSTVTYETKDGVNTKEPKFQLELHGIIYDEETGERTNRRYVISRAIFFEDPQAAITVARENGLEVNEDNQKEFLDEMRYMRMRDWLFENFYQPTITQKKQNRSEMVVGNRIVEVFEISSEESSSIPFDKLKSKV